MTAEPWDSKLGEGSSDAEGWEMKNTNKSVYAITFFLVLILFNACVQPQDKWQGTIEEVNGVTIVKNPTEPKYLEDPIMLEEDLIIGVDEGDENYMFSAPIDIDADSKGFIYILDFRELTIKKYDTNGVFERNISRKGEGPGELQYPYGFCISPQDLIYITDFMERKIEVFNTYGKFQNVIEMNESIELISLSRANNIIVMYDVDAQRDELTRTRISKIGRFDRQSNTIYDFFSKDKPLFKRIQSSEYRLEIPYERFDIDSKGNVYVGTTDEYELSVYSPDGELLKRMSRDFEPFPLDPEIIKKAMEQLSKSSFLVDLQEYKRLLSHYKIFSSISVDEKDRIWISLFQPPTENEEIQVSYFDIFSSDGEYQYRIRAEHNLQRQLVFKNGYVYALAQNESGYSRALRFKIAEN